MGAGEPAIVCYSDPMTDSTSDTPHPAATDVVAFAQALIRCPSVTPAEGGALNLLQQVLETMGLECHRLPFSEAGTPDIDNLQKLIFDALQMAVVEDDKQIYKVSAVKVDSWAADRALGKGANRKRKGGGAMG